MKPKLRFKCKEPNCTATFTRKDHLKTHQMGVHSEETPFSCPQCDKKFKLKQTLTTHIRSHLVVKEEDKIPCEICGQLLKDKTGLRQHVRVQHDTVPTIPCGFEGCSRMFRDNAHLYSHMSMVHLKEKPHKCHICGNNFSTAHGLRGHMESHKAPEDRRVKTVICPESKCPQRFHSAYLAQDHYNQVHCVDRNFKCDQCRSAFKTKGSVRKHVKEVHALIKPHSCQICWASFVRAERLLQHRKIHDAPEHRTKFKGL